MNFVDEYGENVFFDENGDPPASYEVINWQLRDGEVQHVTVGYFSTSTDGTYKFTVKEDNIRWNTGNSVLITPNKHVLVIIIIIIIIINWLKHIILI